MLRLSLQAKDRQVELLKNKVKKLKAEIQRLRDPLLGAMKVASEQEENG